MATTTRTLCRSLLQASRITPAKRKCISHPISSCRPPRRYLSSSISCRIDERPPNSGGRSNISSSVTAEESEDGDSRLPQVDPSEFKTPSTPIDASDLDPVERAEYETLAQHKQEEYLGLRNHYIAMFEEPDWDSKLAEQQISKMDYELEQKHPLDLDPPERLKPAEIGYWAEDEDDEFGVQEDADDDTDESMINAVAESELELHREIRQYTRAAAWDMPLLAKYAKPFDLPATNQVLRFRYTTYMGETHPAENKVVVEFSTKDLAKSSQLTEPQRIKLVKLAGVRYNPDSDIMRMSSEKYEYAAQNKRYLGDLVQKLVKESTNTDDMLEDIPLDYRHHTPKKVHLFPEEWKLTGNRVEELKSLREQENKPALEAPVPRNKKREEEGARRVAQYVAAMPLGRRDNEIRR